MTRELIGNIKGPKGDIGETGTGIVSITEGTTSTDTNTGITTTTYDISLSDGTISHFDVVHGEKGETGATGLKGDKGDGFSIANTYASVSAMNADASNVDEGDFVLIASNVEDEDNAKLYVKGANGFVFQTDLSGATGINGIGISNIVQSLDVTSGTAGNGGIRTSTITYTNGDTSTFIVKDGMKGDTGKGIQGVTKTGTNGLVDTYTITYTDGTSSTFDISNGSNGQQGQQGPQGIQGIQGEQGLIPYLSIDSNGEATGTGNLYVEYITAEEYAQRTSNSNSQG